jgi:hypothetical protein
MIKKITSIKINAINKLIYFLILKKQYFILVLFILFNIKEKNNGKDRRFFSSSLNKITILALDSDRYRGDLESLSFHSGVRVLFMKQNVPGWLIKPFYSELNIHRYINAEKNSNDAIDHKKAYNFMRKFLLVFYKYISIDCVTTVNYRYPEDYNWTKASNDLGVPFIMLYRECLLATNRLYDFATARVGQNFGKFFGSHIIVHNDKCKQMFIDSGYASPDKISVAGALRMDRLLELIRKNKVKDQSENKKQFILFYFPYNTLFAKEKYYSKIWINRDKLFIDLHNAIIELAVEYPDIDFIIKPKKIMVDNISWRFYEDVISNSKVDVKKLKNYRVDENLDAAKNIVNAAVICALQSSVVVESAIANKRVILPLLHDYLSSPYIDDFLWKNDIALFDVATDKSEFKALFKDILINPNIPEEIQHKRTKLFKKWFDNTSGNSLDKYYNIIKNVVQ